MESMLVVHNEMVDGPKSRGGRRWWWMAASLALGVTAVGWVVGQAGIDPTGAAIARALPFLPWVFLLEGFRIATEALATRELFGLLGAELPPGPLVRAQLVGYAIGNVMPVGRTAAEATKASLLQKYADLPKAAAVAAIAQALHLLSSAIILVPALVASRIAGGSIALSFAIAGQCALLACAGTTVLAVAYFAPLGGFAARRLPKLAAALEQFRCAIRLLPRFPKAALGWLVLQRALQVGLIAVLLHAVGAAWSAARPFVAQGVLLVGASAGDVIPGQIGALEGAFTYFADAIGTKPKNALAVALLIHLIQSVWVLVGFLALGIGRVGARALRPRLLPQAPLAARLGGTSVFRAS